MVPQDGQAPVSQDSPAPQQPSGTDTVKISDEARQIQELVKRDREVRTHEAAHAAVGGALAGSPSFTYESGPDGGRYAVGGEVGIDTSAVSGDPEATIEKAQQIRRAALAPAQPSPTDLSVAAQASSMEASARVELQNDQVQVTPEGEDKASVSTEGKQGNRTPEKGRAEVETRVRNLLPAFERNTGGGETLVPGSQLSIAV